MGVDLENEEEANSDGEHTHRARGRGACTRTVIFIMFNTINIYKELSKHSVQLEAIARARFQTMKREENYYFSLYWIARLGHLAGFIIERRY